MKFLILLILLSVTIQAQNVWYVDRDATGANNGLTWADAWNYLDSSGRAGYNGVNWSVIEAGDTIYVSGGTDSTTYLPAVGKTTFWISPKFPYLGGIYEPYDFAEPVIITKAWHEGHNGDVVITSRDGDNNSYGVFHVSDVNNVKFVGLRIIDRRGNSPVATSMTNFYGDNLVFEDCYFWLRGVTGGIGLGGYSSKILNCYIEYEENDLANDLDLFGSGNTKGGHVIDGNIIILRNGNTGTTSHRDIMQLSGDGDATTGTYITTVISNNLVIDEREEGTGWNAMLYFVGNKNLRNLIFNNIIVGRKNNTSIAGFWWDGYESKATTQTAVMLNNTLIIKGSSVNGVNANIDTVISKNNLFIIDTTVGKFYNLATLTGYGGVYPTDAGLVKEIDYNYYARYGGFGSGSEPFATTGPHKTWTQWITGDQHEPAYDANSHTTDSRNVIFVNKYDTVITSYYTETGRGMGVNLAAEYPDLVAEYPALLYDILGNPRGDNWDIGALQWTGSSLNLINVKGKVFLQGPFSSGSMSSHLALNALLPESQPYNVEPWNYNGTESLSLPAGQAGSVVDWVIIELRNSGNPAQVVAKRAALLKNDGTIVDTDGSVGVGFNSVQAGNYYIAVLHRNHLTVMSAVPVQLSSNSLLYDFTTGMNKAYGTNPMKDLGNGRFGLYAGDGNGDGGITIGDRVEVWQLQNGTMGYLGGDFNLDGGVNIIDANLYWSPNNGTMSQVP